MGPSSHGENIFFTKYGGPSDGSPLSGGGIIILHVIRRHFLACEDVAGGSQQSGGGSFCFFVRTHFVACEGVAGGSQQ